MKKTFKDYVMETIQHLVVGGTLTAVACVMYTKTIRKILEN